jgi:hypothetical protein
MKTTRRTIYIVLAVLLTSVWTVNAAERDCQEFCNEHREYGLSANQIAEFETPDYRQLTVNPDMLNDRWYMRVNGEMTVYDAPNGNMIRTLDAGFNFITAQTEQNGWVQINPGEWVPTDQLTNSNNILSHFTGIFLDGGFPEYTVAWMLINAHPSNEPGGDPVDANPVRRRYSLVHIFDEVTIDGWRWYQIAPGEWIQQTMVAKVLPVERPDDVETDKWISIDLYEQVLTVYEGDEPVFATLVATGLPRWPTYEGTFNIYFRQTRRNMSWGTPGDDFYFLEEVPWTMFFDEGRALHGAYWHDGLGYRRSHGCVNLSITDAHWLYTWVAEDTETFVSRDVEPDGTNVYVYSSDAYR